MVNKQNKICLLVCGSFPGLEINNLIELNIIADVEPILIFDKDSSDVNPNVWLKLAETISKKASQFNGFVILHNVDNLLYTAAAISFLSKKINKPIVFASGQDVPGKPRQLELRSNLINAAQAAGSELAEVTIMSGNRLIRANQTKQNIDEPISRLAVGEAGFLGRVDFSVRIFNKLKRSAKPTTKLALEPNITIAKFEPAISYELLKKQLANSKGLVLDAGNYKTLPDKLINSLSQSNKNIPLVIWWPEGTSSSLAPKNLIVINNMTWPTTVVKLMWVLGQTNNLKKVKELISNSIVGEILQI